MPDLVAPRRFRGDSNMNIQRIAFALALVVILAGLYILADQIAIARLEEAIHAMRNEGAMTWRPTIWRQDV